MEQQKAAAAAKIDAIFGDPFDYFLMKQRCLILWRSCGMISSIMTLISRTNTSISGDKSVTMAISDQISVTRVLDMTEVLEGFALRLRELRKQKNLSQTQLGQLAALHYTHIGRFERGASRPGGDTLKRLAGALGVTSDYLLEGAIDDVAKAHFSDRELLKQFQEVERFPDEDKNVVKKLLDAFITKRHLQALAR
ncbi:MAG: helix-turn-helix domain-containing protein [Burkholderiales bacterium]